MPKSNKKILNIGAYRTISFSCGKETVSGSVPKMRMIRKLHTKTCDICSKSKSVDISTGSKNMSNGTSGLNASFTYLNKYISEQEKLAHQ